MENDSDPIAIPRNRDHFSMHKADFSTTQSEQPKTIVSDTETSNRLKPIEKSYRGSPLRSSQWMARGSFAASIQKSSIRASMDRFVPDRKSSAELVESFLTSKAPLRISDDEISSFNNGNSRDPFSGQPRRSRGFATYFRSMRVQRSPWETRRMSIATDMR
jgi:hypothetical protein